MRSLGLRRTVALAVATAALAACGDQATVTAPETAPGPGTLLSRAAVRRAQVPTPEGTREVLIADGHVLVRFREGVDPVAAAAARRLVLDRELGLDRLWSITVPSGEEYAVATALAGDRDVEFAQLDRVLSVETCGTGSCQTPATPRFGYRWDLANTGAVTTTGGVILGLTGKVDADIDWLEMYQALGADFGGTATIGIVDTGIRASHQDLRGRVVRARNLAVGHAADSVGDGDGHGTTVAGIAAGRAAEGAGVPGVAFGRNIRLLNAKACDRYVVPPATTASTKCFESSIADAIVWATDNGANVLNISLGSDPRAAGSVSAPFVAALRYARSRNVLPFCSAGNEAANAVSPFAALADCVAVGSTNWSDQRASYSNTGPQVALSAPGGDVDPTRGAGQQNGLSYLYAPAADADTQYVHTTGTSQATAQAAGLAAMLYAGGLTDANAILRRLQDTADDLGAPGRDPEFGFGRINAYRAVTGRDPNDPPAVEIFRQTETTARAGQPFYVFGRFGDDAGGGPWRYTFSFGDGTTASGTLAALPTANALQYVTKTWTAAGAYVVRYTVTDGSGYAGFAERTVTVLP